MCCIWMKVPSASVPPTSDPPPVKGKLQHQHQHLPLSDTALLKRPRAASRQAPWTTILNSGSCFLDRQAIIYMELAFLASHQAHDCKLMLAAHWLAQSYCLRWLRARHKN